MFWIEEKNGAKEICCVQVTFANNHAKTVSNLKHERLGLKETDRINVYFVPNVFLSVLYASRPSKHYITPMSDCLSKHIKFFTATSAQFIPNGYCPDNNRAMYKKAFIDPPYEKYPPSFCKKDIEAFLKRENI